MAVGPAESSHPDADDDRLVAGCLSGDERCWDALIGSYAPYIYTVAQRACGLGPDAAAEVFQDACIRLYFGLSTYRGGGRFRPWLRAVILSACRDYFRRAARRDQEPIPEPSADALAAIEAAMDVRAAVAALGDPCTSTISLYFFDDMTQGQVASRLGVPDGTVAARLSRCLQRLRGALQESEPAEPSRS